MGDDGLFLDMADHMATLSAEAVGCGAVLVSEEHGLLAAEYNSQRAHRIAVYHAEIKAVVFANTLTGARTLPETTAYCSCEPCAMCLVALSLAKVKRIVYRRTMRDMFPRDPQAQLDSAAFVATLNFVPTLEQA